MVVSQTYLDITRQGLGMGTNELPTKSEQLYSVLLRREFGLICISSESCLGSMVGLPGSCVLVPYVLLYWLRQHQENYCDCALVHLDEHLSRESRKLTVMIKRETVQPLDDSAKSS